MAQATGQTHWVVLTGATKVLVLLVLRLMPIMLKQPVANAPTVTPARGLRRAVHPEASSHPTLNCKEGVSEYNIWNSLAM